MSTHTERSETDRPETSGRTGHSRGDRAADPKPDSADGRYMSLDEISEAYAQQADWMDRLERIDHLLTGRYRRAQFGDAEGRVLDVACGTGVNFRYLPDDVDLVGVDISPEMTAKARDTLADLDVEGSVHEMDAQALDFPDDYFDTVISSLSTCTFPDPVQALEEMCRVCTSDGRIHLFEHGRSDVGPIARFQDWRADAHYDTAGCQWNHEPLEHVREAGLRVDDVDTSVFGIITTIDAAPAPDEA